MKEKITFEIGQVWEVRWHGYKGTYEIVAIEDDVLHVVANNGWKFKFPAGDAARNVRIGIWGETKSEEGQMSLL